MCRGIVQRFGSVAATTTAVAAVIVAVGSLLASAGVAARPGATATALATLVLTTSLWPACAPRPRRLLDRLRVTAVGLSLGAGTLAVLGYVGLGPIPSPVVLLATALVLVPIVPAIVLSIRRSLGRRRVLLVGDDAGRLGDAADALETSPMGYLSPPRLSLLSASPDSLDIERLRTDGGVDPSADEDDTGLDGDDNSHDPDRTETAGVTADDPVVEDGGTPVEDGRPDPPSEAGDPVADVEDSAAGEGDTGPDAVDGVPDGSDSMPDGSLAEEATLEHRSPDAGSAGAESPEDEIPSMERLSGLSRLSNVVRSRDVDAVVLSYSASDRQEFFGGLRCCRELGIDAKVHAFHAPVTLLSSETGAEDGRERIPDGGIDAAAVDDGPLLDAAVEPLPPARRAGKRAFDVCFATAGLVALAPVILVIAAAIKLDSPGPVLYGQRRTARLGRTFPLLKFRSMVDDAEAGTGPTLSDEDAGETDARVTRVGRVLRATHLDEVPQLLSVLRGDMSVVGPRPERPEIDEEIAADGIPWERRWFAKPGLTGLAQINDVTAFRPERKLAYDLEYVERQSLTLDARIVLVQIGMVLRDALDLLRPGDDQ